MANEQKLDREALEQVAMARDKGANVFAETCPQYLYLNLEDHLGKPGFDGAAYVCSTPLRTKHEHHHEDLWKGLRTTNSIENLNREFRRRTKTQGSFCTEDAGLTLLFGLVAFGQIEMRKITGYMHVAKLIEDEALIANAA